MSLGGSFSGKQRQDRRGLIAINDFAAACQSPQGPLPWPTAWGASRDQAPSPGARPAAVSWKDRPGPGPPAGPARCGLRQITPLTPISWPVRAEGGGGIPWASSPFPVPSLCVRLCALPLTLTPTSPGPHRWVCYHLHFRPRHREGRCPARRHTAGRWGRAVTTVPPARLPRGDVSASGPRGASWKKVSARHCTSAPSCVPKASEGNAAHTLRHLRVLWPSPAGPTCTRQPARPGGGWPPALCGMCCCECV